MSSFIANNRGSSITIGLAFLAPIYSEHIRQRPIVVAACAVIGITLVLLPMLLPKRKQNRGGGSNQAGRDVNGQQIIAPNSTINIHPDTHGIVASEYDEGSSRVTEDTVTIDALLLRTVRQSPSGIFKEYQQGQLYALVQISNFAPSVKTEVSVSLNFSDSGKAIHHVNRIYWLNEAENRVLMPVETSRLAVIGFCEDEKWLTFQNDVEDAPTRYAHSVTAWRHQMEKRAVSPIGLPFDRSLQVEVRVITYPHERLAASRLFVLTPNTLSGFVVREDRNQ